MSYIKLPVEEVKQMADEYFARRAEYIIKAVDQKAEEVLEENELYNSKWWHFSKRTTDLASIKDHLWTGRDGFSSEFFPYSNYRDFVASLGAYHHQKVVQLYDSIVRYGTLRFPEGTTCYVEHSTLARLRAFGG